MLIPLLLVILSFILLFAGLNGYEKIYPNDPQSDRMDVTPCRIFLSIFFIILTFFIFIAYLYMYHYHPTFKVAITLLFALAMLGFIFVIPNYILILLRDKKNIKSIVYITTGIFLSIVALWLLTPYPQYRNVFFRNILIAKHSDISITVLMVLLFVIVVYWLKAVIDKVRKKYYENRQMGVGDSEPGKDKCDHICSEIIKKYQFSRFVAVVIIIVVAILIAPHMGKIMDKLVALKTEYFEATFVQKEVKKQKEKEIKTLYLLSFTSLKKLLEIDQIINQNKNHEHDFFKKLNDFYDNTENQNEMKFIDNYFSLKSHKSDVTFMIKAEKMLDKFYYDKDKKSQQLPISGAPYINLIISNLQWIMGHNYEAIKTLRKGTIEKTVNSIDCPFGNFYLTYILAKAIVLTPEKMKLGECVEEAVLMYVRAMDQFDSLIRDHKSLFKIKFRKDYDKLIMIRLKNEFIYLLATKKIHGGLARGYAADIKKFIDNNNPKLPKYYKAACLDTIAYVLIQFARNDKDKNDAIRYLNESEIILNSLKYEATLKDQASIFEKGREVALNLVRAHKALLTE